MGIDFIKSFLKESKMGILWALVVLSFTAGMSIGAGILGPSQEITDIRSDIRGIMCMYVASQQGRSSVFCEFMISEESRALLIELRRSFPDIPQESERRLGNGVAISPSNKFTDEQREWPFN